MSERLLFPKLVSIAAALVLLLGPTVVWSQESDKPDSQAAETPGKDQVSQQFQLADDLDGLFEQLGRTSNEQRGKRISQKIWSKWQSSGSKSIDLLTGWARTASGNKDFSAALDLLDQVVVLRPEYAEGWNQRATIHFLMNNYVKSIADIERTLALEPRHYGALAGLAQIQLALGDKKGALTSWHRVLAIYPSMKNGQDSVIKLEEELSGSGI